LLSLSAIHFNKRTADRESHFWLTSCVAILAFTQNRAVLKESAFVIAAWHPPLMRRMPFGLKKWLRQRSCGERGIGLHQTMSCRACIPADNGVQEENVGNISPAEARRMAGVLRVLMSSQQCRRCRK